MEYSFKTALWGKGELCGPSIYRLQCFRAAVTSGYVNLIKVESQWELLNSHSPSLYVKLGVLKGVFMIDYHNPDAPIGVEEIPYELSLAVKPEAATTIGLLANGFPDSVEFLNAVGDAIQALFPGITLRAYNKGNATIPAGDKLLQEITGECAGVIAAYGH